MNRSKGFSLLEILVVLVVIGVIVSGATVAINFGGIDRELDKVVERLVSYCDHAADTAVFDGEPVGLVLVPPAWRDNPLEEGWQYYWQKLGVAGWQNIDELEPMDLASEYELAVTLDGELWEPLADDRPELPVPAIVFFPGGDLTRFEIEVSHRDIEDTEHILVDDWGKVVWQEKAALLEEIEEVKQTYN